MNKTKMINSLKELPCEIQNLIYNEYLEKQRDYHIDNYNNKINLLYIKELLNIINKNSYIIFKIYLNHNLNKYDDNYNYIKDLEDDFKSPYYDNKNNLNLSKLMIMVIKSHKIQL